MTSIALAYSVVMTGVLFAYSSSVSQKTAESLSPLDYGVCGLLAFVGISGLTLLFRYISKRDEQSAEQTAKMVDVAEKTATALAVLTSRIEEGGRRDGVAIDVLRQTLSAAQDSSRGVHELCELHRETGSRFVITPAIEAVAESRKHFDERVDEVEGTIEKIRKAVE